MFLSWQDLNQLLICRKTYNHRITIFIYSRADHKHNKLNIANAMTASNGVLWSHSLHCLKSAFDM